MISTKANPYFDDFDASKGYYQMLFKPGNAIQARELTQLQTILRDQIAKFGNHIFQHGSVVIPGNSLAELNVPYVTLQETDLQISLFEGSRIVGATSGVQAIVKKAVGPVSATFYLSYVSGGGANGQIGFWVNNALNKDYQAFYFETMSRGFAQKGRPVQVGIDIRCRF
jgi:hypothetical protein